MEVTLDKIELVRDRTGVSYKEAKDFFNGLAYVIPEKIEVKIDKTGRVVAISENAKMSFDDMVSINGTYAVKDKLLIVKCHIDDSSGVEEGYDVIFNFEISNNGQTLSFDHSDPNEEGTIGNDYMSITEE